MLEVKITVDLLGLPEALNNLAKALTKTERPFVAPPLTPATIPIPKDGPSDTPITPPQVTNTTATANTPAYTLDAWRKEMPQGQPQKPPQVTAKLQELPTDQPLQEYSDDEDIPF